MPETPHDLATQLREAYSLVAMFPERKPDGFMNLLALRNLTPDAANAIDALTAERAVLMKEADRLQTMACGSVDAARDAEAEVARLTAELAQWKADSAAAWDKCEERRVAQEKAEAERDALRAQVTKAHHLAEQQRLTDLRDLFWGNENNIAPHDETAV